VSGLKQRLPGSPVNYQLRADLNAEPAGRIRFCGQLIAGANGINAKREGGELGCRLINKMKIIERLSAT